MKNSIQIVPLENEDKEVWRVIEFDNTTSKSLMGIIKSNRKSIKMGDVVFGIMSQQFFYCENKKMEKWMNMNEYYIILEEKDIPGPEYFRKGN